jgi:hypothetical protein
MGDPTISRTVIPGIIDALGLWVIVSGNGSNKIKEP